MEGGEAEEHDLDATAARRQQTMEFVTLRKTGVFLVLALGLPLMACGNDGRLIGKWENPETGSSVEFTAKEMLILGKAIPVKEYKSDNDRVIVSLEQNGQTVSATYIVKDADTICQELEGILSCLKRAKSKK